MGQKNKPRCNTNIRKEVKVILTEELIPQVKVLELRYPKSIQKRVDVKLSLSDAKCLIDYIKMTEHMIDYVNVIASLVKPIRTYKNKEKESKNEQEKIQKNPSNVGRWT